MTKPKKQRAENYEEKLSIEGSFEDVIGVSVSQKNTAKFKVGERVIIYKDPHNIPYEVLASKENIGNYLLSEHMDYLIQVVGSNITQQVFEDDIIHEKEK